MAQMLPMIQIVPNMNLALDPVSGVIGASLGEGVILLSMDEINNEVTKLQGAADELVSSLDPYTSPARDAVEAGRLQTHYCAWRW